MHRRDLQPITFIIKLNLSEKSSIARWGEIINYYLEFYAKKLCENQNVYIGHIKALSIPKEKEYIKYSKFKEDIPAQISVMGESFYDSISLTVNSLVYGVTEKNSINALELVANKMIREFLIETKFTIGKSDKNHEHPHHYHSKNH